MSHQAWRDTPQWRATRKAALERDGHRCVACGRGRADGTRLHVDHIVRADDGGERYDLTNCQTLCSTCHSRKTGRETAYDNKRRSQARKVQAEKREGGGTSVSPMPIAKISPNEPPVTADSNETGENGRDDSDSRETIETVESFDESGVTPGPIHQNDPTASRVLTGAEPSGEPRFFSDPHPNRVDSRGAEWGAWMQATFGEAPRPSQLRVADRMLEIDKDGRWCWPVFVYSVPRQRGKSWVLRGVLAWLASQGLLVVGTVNRLRTAAEVIRPLGRWVLDNGGKWHRAIDQPAVEWPNGGRVVFQAATDALAVGWSPDAGAVDEAWDVPAIPVMQGLVPAMSDKDNPFLLFTSTVGTTTSDLLTTYRDYALSGEQTVGIAEWGAPPGTDWRDEEVWRQATPEWSATRLRFMRQQAKTLGESAFRSQMLNQAVHAEDSWISPSVWASSAALAKPATGGTVAVEIALDGALHFAVHAVRDSEGIVRTTLHTFRSFREVDSFIHLAARPTTVLAPGVYRDRLSRLDRMVGSSDISSSMPVFLAALNDGRVRHVDDPRLSEQMLMARAHTTKAGQQTLVSADGRPLSAVRALLWAVANESEQRQARPRLRVAR